MDDLTFKIILAIVSVVAGLVGVYLLPFLKAKAAELKIQVEDWKKTQLGQAITAAVQAAEKSITGGACKKEYVLELAKEVRDIYGLEISDEQLNALIEAAVYSIDSSKK